jgi:hypothetical protein
MFGSSAGPVKRAYGEGKTNVKRKRPRVPTGRCATVPAVKKLAALLVLVPALVLAGAGAAATSPLHGVWATKVKSTAPVLNGAWLISFASNGTYAVVKEPNTKSLLVGGVSTVSGNTLTMTDKTGPASCPGSTARAKYSFKITGKTLKLTKISEPCTGRGIIFAGSFTKVG